MEDEGGIAANKWVNTVVKVVSILLNTTAVRIVGRVRGGGGRGDQSFAQRRRWEGSGEVAREEQGGWGREEAGEFSAGWFQL